MARPRTQPSRTEAGTPLVARVFAALADGSFHSGEELARALKVSRSAVWKAAKTLRALGATVEAVRNRGYRLADPGEPLQSAKIRAGLTAAVRAHVASVETAWSIASTNSVLLARPNPPPGKSEVLLAECQSAGRGRRGRTWLAPPGGSVCLSLSWTFREVPADLGALGLVVGVCVLRALSSLQVRDVQLKWPNDLIVHGSKLGGVLIELRAESAGPACVVIGIGLNTALGAAVLAQIARTGLPATDLRTVGPPQLTRNRLVAAVLNECICGLLQFEREALKPFIADWGAADALIGKAVNVDGGRGLESGMARGIDVHGALLIETATGLKRFISGDVSVRPA